jgi:hypothetical protein
LISLKGGIVNIDEEIMVITRLGANERGIGFLF